MFVVKLPAWRPHLTVREVAHPKLYWFDPGVCRAAAGLLDQPLDALWRGSALETLIVHEIRCFLEFQHLRHELFFYRTASGLEVDLIIQIERKTLQTRPKIIAIEIKSSKSWDRSWEKPLRTLLENDSIVVQKAFGLYLGEQNYQFEFEFKHIQVLPVNLFLKMLHAGEVFSKPELS